MLISVFCVSQNKMTGVVNATLKYDFLKLSLAFSRIALSIELYPKKPFISLFLKLWLKGFSNGRNQVVKDSNGCI